MQDLSNQLQTLQLENERLQSQNRTLKLAALCQRAVAPGSDAQVHHSSGPWIDLSNWGETCAQLVLSLSRMS